MRIEKIYFKATDNLELVGLLHKGENKTKNAIISIHGMTSNCFKQREDTIAKKVTEVGFDYFAFNNRGHDVQAYTSKVDENGKVSKLNIGTAFEDVEESYFDICGAIIKMKENGYENIYLQGHSLGCTKIVFSYSKMKKENGAMLAMIKGIILLSLVDIPRAQKIFLGEKFDDVMKIAMENEEKGKFEELMPREVFIHPISTKTYLRYFRDFKNIDFARYYDKEYDYQELNNINVPLFMRWGNVNEMIEQNADDLVRMLNFKIYNRKKDINFIDGADHGYTGKYDILADEIIEFLRNV